MIKKLLLALLLIPSLAFAAPVDNPNTSKNKAQSLSESFVDVPFAELGSLPPQYNGTVVYCPDCGTAVVCSGGGGPALALAINGTWNCQALSNTNAGGGGPATISPLTATLDAAGHSITNAVIPNAQVNGQLAVTGFPFYCKGDDSADDTTCFQAAINQMGGSATLGTCTGKPHPDLLVPYTGSKYKISEPLQDSCGDTAIYGPQQGEQAILDGTFIGPTMYAYKYGTTSLEYGSPLVGATGNSLNMKNFADGHGYVVLNYALNSAIGSLNGLPQGNITIVISLTSLGGAGGDQQPIFSSSNTANAAAAGSTSPSFYIRLNQTGSQFQSGITDSTSGAVNFDTWSPVINTTYEISINKSTASGGTCQLFVNGNQSGATKTCAGNWVMHPYEMITIPSVDSADWPGVGNNRNSAWGFIDSIKVENTSVHTTNYTPNTTTKPTPDSNTLYLTNFETPDAQTAGTLKGYVGSSTNAYFPIQNNHGQMFRQTVQNIDFCGNTTQKNSGLYAQDSPNSKWLDLTCTNNGYGGLDLNSIIYNSEVKNITVGGGSFCVNFGQGFSEATSLVEGLHCTQLNVPSLHTCYVSNSASFAEVGSACQDVNNPGDLIYPWQEMISHITHINTFQDAEGGASTVMKASFGWIQQPYAPEVIINPEGNTRNNAPFIQQSGGKPIEIDGLAFDSQEYLQLINITSVPSGPDMVRNSSLTFNGNHVCHSAGTPLACCSGSGTGTCSTMPLSNLPTLVDTQNSVYDNGTPVPNLENNGFTLPSSSAGFLTLGLPGFVCPKNGVANSTTVTTAKPICSQPGVVEVCIAGASNVPTLNIASSDSRTWHQIGSTVVDGGDNNSEGAAWWSVAPANEGTTTVTLGTSGQIQTQCGVMVGVDSLNPILASNTAVNGFGGPPRAVTAPAVVTGNVNAYELQFAEFNVSGIGTYTTSGLPTNAQGFQNTSPQPGLIGAVWNATGDPSSTGTYTYSGSASIVAFSIIFNPASSLGVAPALPQNPTHLVTTLNNSCKGDVTLSAGAGTFTNACVTTASACDSRDITTPANLCVVAAPGSGSVGLTGTVSDVCRTVCQ